MQMMRTSISCFADKLFLGISWIYFLLQVGRRLVPPPGDHCAWLGCHLLPGLSQPYFILCNCSGGTKVNSYLKHTVGRLEVQMTTETFNLHSCFHWKTVEWEKPPGGGTFGSWFLLIALQEWAKDKSGRGVTVTPFSCGRKLLMLIWCSFRKVFIAFCSLGDHRMSAGMNCPWFFQRQTRKAVGKCVPTKRNILAFLVLCRRLKSPSRIFLFKWRMSVLMYNHPHANLESVLAEAWLQAFKFLLCFWIIRCLYFLPPAATDVEKWDSLLKAWSISAVGAFCSLCKDTSDL